MSLSSSLMKEITHYFRPSIKNDEETDGCRGYSKSNSNVEADDELKSDDCELYLSGSDNDSDFVTPKKKHHLVVQVPGISVSKCSVRKRKRKEDLSPRVKKIRTLQSDSPVSRTRKFNGENEKAEDSCYMSPLRLDSDSSSEGSPVRKQTSSNRQSEASPVYRATGKRKGSLRLAKNPFLNSSKSTSDTTVDNPKKSKKSISPKSPVKKPSKEKELGGSLYKFFGNVMSPKAKIPEIKCISLPSDEQPEVVLLSPCDKPGKGDSTLTKKSVQPREKAANISVSADHNHVGISQQVESVTKSPAESSVSMGKTLRDREASSSIRQADGSKGSRLLPSPKIVSELRNSASNNILNYFDKASKPTKSKKKKVKKLKRRPEEKVMPEVAAAVEIDTVNLSTDSVLEITEPTEIENTKARRSSLRSLSLSSSESTKRSGVQEKSDNVRTKSIDPATCGTCDSSGKETIVTRRRSRTSVSNVSSNESVTPSVNQNKSPSILKNQAPPVSIKGGSSSHAQTKQGLSTSQKKGESYAKKNVGNQLSSRNQRPNKSTAGKSSINKKEVSTGKKPSNNRKSSGGAGKSVGQSSKKSPTSVKKVISPSRSNQKSANQCRAAKIVKRACQPTLQRQIIRRIRDPGIPGSKSLDEVIILSEQTENGTTKEIVIRPSYVKLAPLFVAKEEYQRKKFFLQSGVPDIVLRRMKEQKRMEVELEEASDFPSVSHTLQIDASFPWCLEENPTLSKNLSLSPVDPVGEQEKILSILSEKLCLGCISSLPSILAAMLVQLRPPLPNLDSPEGSPSRTLDSPGSPHCFCLEMSPDVSIDETSQEFSSHDVEMFERVHAWLMRSLLPPGVAFKMCVDLSFFLPSSSPAGFESDHIFALPHDSSGPVLRKQMLLKLKEEYPSYPVNRKYKDFYQRRKTDGGLYPFSHPPGYEVIILDSPPPDNDVSDKSSSKNSSSDPKTLFSTPSNSRRSSRRGSVMQSTPSVVEAKEVSGQNSDSIMNSLLSMNDTAVKASCSSLLTSESWTDVFAPVSFADACSLGRNLKTLDKLRNWLDSWAKKTTSSKKSKSSNGFSDSDEEYSSGIEFCSSDEEDGKRENRNLPTNVAILIGPCGSGKTSSVYALAKELNYKVLEINASAKRSGKYILATVKEATRSYQVMSSGGQNSPASIGSFFKKSTPKKSPASTRKRTPKKSPKPAEKASSAMSLIFVEDVDVVFENEDEGFIGALTSLTTSTKRPVILEVHMSKPLRMGTTNNWLLEEMLTESCPHLINFLAKQNRTPLILPFVRTRNTLHSEALLRVACLSEGVWVSKQWSECLFKHTAGDFRRAIQGAQFWAGSVARSSIMLDNLTRYPKQLTQKSDMSDEKSADLMAKKLAPVNLCGCLGRKACSYPYSWMHKDYIQHIWLKLDKIVDTAMLIMQGVASSGSASEKVFCLSPSVGRTLKSASKEGSAIKQEPSPISPKSEVSSEVPLIKKNLLSMFNDSMKSEKEDLGGTPSSVRLSPRINKGNRRIRLTPSRRKNVSLPNHHLDPVDVKHKVKVNEGEKTEEDTPKDVASEKLKSLVGGRRYSPKDCHKMDIMAFDDYLDVLCTSDVLLKKFQTAGDLELGKSMVFEMGNVSRLINISMRVSNSEKSREMEAKQAKDSCTAAQYQMILPIMPNHWLLNCPALALDVAPHIRETCRILDELTQTGKTRTRLSHRIPTINRLGPTLREALSRTLVDDINIHDLPSVDIELKKEEEKCVN